MARFDSKSLSQAQYNLARLLEAKGITSYSQAIKAFNRGDDEQIATWKKQLAEKQAAK